MFENLVTNFAISILLVLNLVPINGLVFAGRVVNNCELIFVTNVRHAPVKVPLVVIAESLLTIGVTIWQLEDLLVQILFLSWNHERNFLSLNVFMEHFNCICWEIELFQLLVFQFFLLHVDDFGEEVVVGKRMIIKHISHLLLDCLINLYLLLAKRIIKLSS